MHLPAHCALSVCLIHPLTCTALLAASATLSGVVADSPFTNTVAYVSTIGAIAASGSSHRYNLQRLKSTRLQHQALAHQNSRTSAPAATCFATTKSLGAAEEDQSVRRNTYQMAGRAVTHIAERQPTTFGPTEGLGLYQLTCDATIYIPAHRWSMAEPADTPGTATFASRQELHSLATVQTQQWPNATCMLSSRPPHNGQTSRSASHVQQHPKTHTPTPAIQKFGHSVIVCWLNATSGLDTWISGARATKQTADTGRVKWHAMVFDNLSAVAEHWHQRSPTVWSQSSCSGILACH